MTNLFQLGDFTLSSGAKSVWKIECDALTEDDIEALAEMIRRIVRPFASVEGVPSGGLRLAKALKKYSTLYDPQSRGASLFDDHLIVDDVLTTGRSMQRIRASRENNYPRLIISGAVVFARGRCPVWVTPLFQMPQQLWQ